MYQVYVNQVFTSQSLHVMFIHLIIFVVLTTDITLLFSAEWMDIPGRWVCVKCINVLM